MIIESSPIFGKKSKSKTHCRPTAYHFLLLDEMEQLEPHSPSSVDYVAGDQEWFRFNSYPQNPEKQAVKMWMFFVPFNLSGCFRLTAGQRVHFFYFCFSQY